MIVLAEMCKIIEPCVDLMVRDMWGDAITPYILAPACDVKPSTVLFCSRVASVLLENEQKRSISHLPWTSFRTS